MGLSKRVGYFLTFIFFVSTFTANANGISDPVVDFVEKEFLYQDSRIYKVISDINGDGSDDFLLSSSAPHRDNSKAGVLWVAYLSSGDFYVVADGDELVFNPGSYVLKPIPEHTGSLNNAILSYFPASAREGSIGASYVEGTSIVTISVKKGVRLRELDGVEDDISYAKSIFSNGLDSHVDRIQLGNLLSPDEISALPRKEDDFYYKHDFVLDPSNKGRQLVYIRGTKELVGYLNHGQPGLSEYIPINQKDNDGKDEGGERKKSLLLEAVVADDTSNSEGSKDESLAAIEEIPGVDQEDRGEGRMVYFLVLLGLIVVFLLVVRNHLSKK